jgi:hypothetical protein
MGNIHPTDELVGPIQRGKSQEIDDPGRCLGSELHVTAFSVRHFNNIAECLLWNQQLSRAMLRCQNRRVKPKVEGRKGGCTIGSCGCKLNGSYCPVVIGWLE